MRRRLLALAILLWLLVPPCHAGGQHLLLVAAKGHSFTPLTTLEVRKLFLGLPVTRGGQQLVPLINISDPMTHQIFLQKVIFMSDTRYRHQLLLRVFRRGGVQPRFYSDPEELGRALNNTTGGVTYLSGSPAPLSTEIEVIQVLWQNPAE